MIIIYTLTEFDYTNCIDLSKQISDDLGNQIISAINNLGKNMRPHLLFQIVKRNLEETLSFLVSVQKAYSDQSAIECNRHLFNFLDSFYAYINFYERYNTEIFKEVKTSIYDSHYEYRFLYNLRNYCIHEDLGVLRTTNQLFSNSIKIIFEVDNQKLIASTVCNKKFKNELMKLNQPTTDISTVLSPFFAILLEMHTKMLLKNWDSLRNDFSLLMDNIPSKNDVFILKDGKIDNSLLNVASKYYKTVSENFIYTENHLNETQIKKFFDDISFLYFKRTNCYLKSPLMRFPE